MMAGQYIIIISIANMHNVENNYKKILPLQILFVYNRATLLQNNIACKNIHTTTHKL